MKKGASPSPAAAVGKLRNGPKKVGSEGMIKTSGFAPAVFDDVAADYDDDFTNTALARILRKRVWRRLGQNFRPGQHILELACGTGEDALWLAGQGFQVTATDGSPEMIRIVQEKASQHALTDHVTTQVLSLQSIAAGEGLLENQSFDGVFSNFGGLNTLDDWSSLAKALARLVRPGGRVVLVPMGPFCPWEILWHLAHGQPKEAWRRFDRPAQARIGGHTIPVWYPSVGQLRRAFSPWYKQRSVESLGLWLPPVYLGHLLSRWSQLWVGLSGLETLTAGLFSGAGDHYILVLER
jgi:ubiquinone/menaquinone biosynthesis C-methylase UbiE